MTERPNKMVDGQIVPLSDTEWVDYQARAPGSQPDPVPEIISDRQFAQQLAINGTITQDEALAWAARGDLPAALLTALQNIPEEGGQRFGAKMLLSAATTYERSHALVPTLGGLMGYDSDALDQLWRDAVTL